MTLSGSLTLSQYYDQQSNILARIYTFYSLIDLTLSLFAYNFNNVIDIASDFNLKLK